MSVGNITVGGTGKTPMVEWVARALSEAGRRPAIASRGYRRTSQLTNARGEAVNDEYQVLAMNLPGVAHYLGKNRYASGKQAQRDGYDVLILDDGFQHVVLHRDLNLVLLDATGPFGGGRVLPAGRLREPLSALREADLIVWTRSELVTSNVLQRWIAQVAMEFPTVPQACVETHAEEWVSLAGPQASNLSSVDSLRGELIYGFCGIGNPGAFRLQLEALGCRLVGWKEYGDHHVYSPGDLRALAAAARATGARILVTTQKDAVKLLDPEKQRALDGMECRFLRIHLRFRWGEETLRRQLSGLKADS